MNSLIRGGDRQPRELPPVLSTEEIERVLAGEITPAAPSGYRPHVAASLTPPREAYPDPIFSPQPTPTAELPDPRIWVSRFGIALLECLEGHRPPLQLARHVQPEVLSRLNRRYRAALRRGKRPGPTGIKRVRVCLPRDGVAEAALVTRIGGRPTPIALRMCGVDGRWVVTNLEMV